MKIQEKTVAVDSLVLVGRRRNWIPGRLAVWMFLAGFYDIWPINKIIWEKQR